MGLENTPPASPGVGGLDDDDQIYDDEIAEEIDVGEGVMEEGVRFVFSRILDGYHKLLECWNLKPLSV